MTSLQRLAAFAVALVVVFAAAFAAGAAVGPEPDASRPATHGEHQP